MEEAIRKATIGAVEIILKRQKLTITSIKDVGVRLMENSDIDSAFFEERLAGTACCLLLFATAADAVSVFALNLLQNARLEPLIPEFVVRHATSTKHA